jgi:hypothetical protein
MFEGNGGLPTAADAAEWAEATGLDGPVTVEPTKAIAKAMPFEGEIPARCALTPDMVMIGCYSGEPVGRDPAIDAILAHAKGAP